MKDIGIEVTIEPGIVPKGTFDPRALDAHPGTAPPPRRIDPDGRVHALAESVSPSSAPTTVVVPATPPATPAVETPSALAHQEALALDGSEPGVAAAAKRPRAPRRPLLPASAETAMPPRPASASEKSSSRLSPGALLPEDDHETAQISGGFASGLATLVKVTCVLSALAVLVVCTFLYWNGLLPFFGPRTTGTEEVAVKPVEQPRPETKTPVEIPKPDVAPATTDTVARLTTATEVVAKLPDPPKPSTKDSADFPPVEPEEPKVVKRPTQPEAVGSIDVEKDYDVNKVEELRKQALLLYYEGKAAKTREQASKKFTAAIAKFDELLALKPKDADALFRKGNNLDAIGEVVSATRAYEAAAALSSTDGRPWNNLGLIREAKSDWPGARAAYEKGLSCEPRNAELLVNLGRLEMASDPKAALGHFDRALERDERNVYTRYNRAVLLALKLDRVDEAKKELTKLSEEDQPLRADALHMLGDLAMNAGKVSEADALYRRALAVRPDLDEARLSLGVALFARGDNERAEKELNAYLEKHPKSAQAWQTLAGALDRLGRLKEGKIAYEKALEQDDKDPRTHFGYAVCAERFGNFNFAIPEYERVLKLDPKHWMAMTNLARLYHKAGRHATALELIDRSIAVQTSCANSHLLRASILVGLKRDGEARLALGDFVKYATPGDKRIAEAKRALDGTGDLVLTIEETPPLRPLSPRDPGGK